MATCVLRPFTQNFPQLVNAGLMVIHRFINIIHRQIYTKRMFCVYFLNNPQGLDYMQFSDFLPEYVYFLLNIAIILEGFILIVVEYRYMTLNKYLACGKKQPGILFQIPGTACIYNLGKGQ
jgi:hypothetical protein